MIIRNQSGLAIMAGFAVLTGILLVLDGHDAVAAGKAGANAWICNGHGVAAGTGARHAISGAVATEKAAAEKLVVDRCNRLGLTECRREACWPT